MSLKGDPATSTTVQPPAIPPPGFDFARAIFGNILPSLMGGRFPTYPRNVDPGLSPTMQTAMRMGQGYASSPAPFILGRAGGMLGNFMNPQLANVGWGGGQNPNFFQMPQPSRQPNYPGSYNPWRFQGGAPPTGGGGMMRGIDEMRGPGSPPFNPTASPPSGGPRLGGGVTDPPVPAPGGTMSGSFPPGAYTPGIGGGPAQNQPGGGGTATGTFPPGAYTPGIGGGPAQNQPGGGMTTILPPGGKRSQMPQPSPPFNPNSPIKDLNGWNWLPDGRGGGQWLPSPGGGGQTTPPGPGPYQFPKLSDYGPGGPGVPPTQRPSWWRPEWGPWQPGQTPPINPNVPPTGGGGTMSGSSPPGAYTPGIGGGPAQNQPGGGMQRAGTNMPWMGGGGMQQGWGGGWGGGGWGGMQQPMWQPSQSPYMNPMWGPGPQQTSYFNPMQRSPWGQQTSPKGPK